MGITRIRGRYNSFTGGLTVGDDGSWQCFTFEIDASSIDTGRPDLDDALRSADYFDVGSHRVHRFKVQGINAPWGPNAGLEGRLTMNGITHPLYVSIEVRGPVRSRDRITRAGMCIRGAISRAAFGLQPTRDPLTASLADADLVTFDVELAVILAAPRPEELSGPVA